MKIQLYSIMICYLFFFFFNYRVEIVRMSDKSFYSEAKKVMPVDFLPTPSKIGLGYTILNPFKHFLKKKELFTPAEAAEMRRSRNSARKVNLNIATTNSTEEDQTPIEYEGITAYPNESIVIEKGVLREMTEDDLKKMEFAKMKRKSADGKTDSKSIYSITLNQRRF